MRSTRIWTAALLMLPSFYVALPLWAAWDLRQAVKLADRERLSARVEWAELRANLKQRIMERSTATQEQKGGWIRKQATRILAPTIADRSVDLVVTPERLAWLLKRRLDWRAFRGTSPETRGPTTNPDAGEVDDDPLALEPSRLKWAFFESPSAFRIEVRDKSDPRRTLVARLAWRGLGWKLIDIDRIEPARIRP